MAQLDPSSLILTRSSRVSSAEADLEARLRLGALVNLLIQSAIESAEQLGFGFERVRQQQLFWVLSRLSLQLERPLQWGEVLSVSTWPKDVEGLMYLRDFELRGEDQALALRSTSAWLAIDLARKRPRRLQGLEAEKFVRLRDKHALSTSPEKLPAVREGRETEVVAAYSDLDLNRHVTSTRYIDWAMNTLALDFLQTHYPHALSINFLKETLAQQVVQVITEQVAPDTFLFEGRHVQADPQPYGFPVCFRARISFTKA